MKWELRPEYRYDPESSTSGEKDTHTLDNKFLVPPSGEPGPRPRLYLQGRVDDYDYGSAEDVLERMFA